MAAGSAPLHAGNYAQPKREPFNISAEPFVPVIVEHYLKAFATRLPAR
jgi:hypothetical protein